MRKLLIFLTILLASTKCFATDGVSTVPAIFFSDLTSGPATSGKGNAGVFISIYGKNFGSSRGTSTITVNGTEASNYEVWLDTYAAFQMGSGTTTGNILLTTTAGASNALPFTVRAGNIYFVDVSTPTAGDGSYGNHWKSPRSAWETMTAGDTVYVRAGTYTGTYGTGGSDTKYNISFGAGAAAGTEGNEIAWCGYPGEIARLEANEVGVRTNNFDMARNYYVIANLQCYARGSSTGIENSNIRFIGNSIEANKVSCFGAVQVTYATPTNIKIYGNEIFGATSGDKFDHPIYVAKTCTNVDIGWNYIHNNDVGLGPMISVHKDGAVDTFTNINIHDNILDGTGEGADGLRGIYVGNMMTASTINIYNNIIKNCGPKMAGYGGVIYFGDEETVTVYNNTFYNVEGAGDQIIEVWTDNPSAVSIKNNIIFLKPGSTDDYIAWVGVSTPTISNNCYYGNGNGTTQDASPVNADPGFTNPAGGNFVLLSTSTCRDTGVDIIGYTSDIVGVTRPQNNTTDIGAYEYFMNTVDSITNKLLYGTWKKGSF